MTFNIGSQHAGQINNVAGDQTIHGGEYSIGTPAEALAALRVLSGHLDAVTLAPAKRRAVKRDVDDIDEQLRRPEPDRSRIAERLTRVTKVLVAAGALATGGTALGQAIAGLASWLGTLGVGVLGLVGASPPGRP